MSKKRKFRANLTDFFTSLFVTMAIVVGGYFIHLFQEPMSVLNPFPPIEQPIQLPMEEVRMAVTETIANLPTRTPTPPHTLTPQPTNTDENLPTATTENTATQQFIPSNTPDPEKVNYRYVTPADNVDAIFYTPTPHPVADYLYEFSMLHEAEPQQSPWNNFVANPILNCNWFGVGGQVFDYFGNPMLGARVKLGGTYPGTDQFIELYTSTSYEHVQGDGGYEFKLSDEPFEAFNAFWVQVIDENGDAISAKAHFSITKHCTVNLIRIDFIQRK